MRTKKEIIEDPSASEAEIEHLAEEDVAAAIMHPNCPKELWWELVTHRPGHMISSPAYQLMVLESPDLWQWKLADCGRFWVSELMRALPPVDRFLLAGRMVEHALPAFEVVSNDPRLRGVIDAYLKRMSIASDIARVNTRDLLSIVESVKDEYIAELGDQVTPQQRAARSVVWAVRYLLDLEEEALLSDGGSLCCAEIEDDELAWQFEAVVRVITENGLRWQAHVGFAPPKAASAPNIVGAYATTLLDASGKHAYDVYVNPTCAEIDKQLQLAQGVELRALALGQDLYVWQAYFARHWDVATALQRNTEPSFLLEFFPSADRHLTIEVDGTGPRAPIDWGTHPFFAARPRLFSQWKVSFREEYALNRRPRQDWSAVMQDIGI